MVKTFDGQNLTGITAQSLNLLPGELSGNLIDGGTITHFSSTGIQDNATTTALVVTDGNISVASITAPTITGNTTVRGDLKVYGVLDAGFVRTTELITNQRYEKQYIEFAIDNEQGTNVGTGLLWPSDSYNKQLVYRNNPDRFFMTESVDIAPDKSYLIGGLLVLNSTSLGNGIVNSSLKTLGNLTKLNVTGDVNFADIVFFDSASGKLSIGNAQPTALFSVYDSTNDIEIILDGTPTGRGVFGTFNTKALDVVTDDQVRISIETNGNITLGQPLRDSTVIKMFGTVGIGVNKPTAQLEVAGDIRFNNKLFTTGTEPPTSGSYMQGDVVWNASPMPTGWVGWICVAAGNPGLWKPFAQISA